MATKKSTTSTTKTTKKTASTKDSSLSATVEAELIKHQQVQNTIEREQNKLKNKTDEFDLLLKEFEALKAKNASLEIPHDHEALIHDEKSRQKVAEKQFQKKLEEIEKIEKDAAKYNERLSQKYQMDVKNQEKELTKESVITDDVSKRLEEKIKALELENADLKHATKVYGEKLSMSEKRRISSEEERRFHEEGIYLTKDSKELFINWRKTPSMIGKEIDNKFLAYYRTPLMFIGMILLLCTLVGIFYVYFYAARHDHKISKVGLKAAVKAGYKPITQIDKMKLEKYNL